MTCVLVTCYELQIPHHQDTHAREDHTNSTECVRPRPSLSTHCWQCELSKPMYEDVEPRPEFL